MTGCSFPTVVLPFCEAAREQHIDVAIGRRYAAAAKNNFMQVFSARFLHDDSPHIRTLAELSVQGRLNAAQLELGVGLRWPGPERERFVRVFCHTLGNSLQNGVMPDRQGRVATFLLFLFLRLLPKRPQRRTIPCCLWPGNASLPA